MGAATRRTGDAGDAGDARPRTSGRRKLAVLVVAALAGAASCAVAAAMPWWTRSFDDPLAGTVHTAANGSELLGELVPIALVALAGLGASFATRGIARRAVGALVALGGLLAAARAGAAIGMPPVELLAGQLKRPATPVGPVDLALAGPVVALVGGLLIAIAGVLIATGSDRARRMGTSYDAPARRRERTLRQAREHGAGGTAAERPDPSELWRAMDAGADLTGDAPDPAGPLHPSAPEPPGQATPSGPDTIGAPNGPDAVDADPRDLQ